MLSKEMEQDEFSSEDMMSNDEEETEDGRDSTLVCEEEASIEVTGENCSNVTDHFCQCIQDKTILN